MFDPSILATNLSHANVQCALIDCNENVMTKYQIDPLIAAVGVDHPCIYYSIIAQA